MWSVILHVVRKELIQTFRDRRMVFFIFVAPVVQLTIFGFAATFDVNNIRLAVADRDQTSASRYLVQKFTASPYFNRGAVVATNDEEGQLLDLGKADAVLVIPKEYAKKVRRGEQATVQFLIDGTNSNSATIIQNYLDIIMAGVNQEFSGEKASGGATRSRGGALILPDVRVWYNEMLEASQFMVPGVFAMILFVITTVLTAMGLTRERETGTYEQLIVSPIEPMAIMIGKTLPFALLGLISVTLILVAAYLIFGVVIKGSLLLFYLTVLAFLMTTLSLGIFVSSIAVTMQQALMLSFFVMLPMIILSGLMFPISNMPIGFQGLTYFNPLRYFLEVIRGLFLKAVGPYYVLPRVMVLFLMGTCLMMMAALRFNKKLQ